jgi:hypothetical protein
LDKWKSIFVEKTLLLGFTISLYSREKHEEKPSLDFKGEKWSDPQRLMTHTNKTKNISEKR